MCFKIFKEKLQDNITKILENQNKIFVVEINKDELWEIYLNSYPDEYNKILRKRKEHDCSCCRHFIKNFGGCVVIKENKLISIWDIPDLEYPYNIVAENLSKYIKSKKIIDLFITKEKKIGINNNKQILENGLVITWDHFYFELPNRFAINPISTIDSIKGSYRTNKEVFQRSIEEISLESGLNILELIQQGSLYRGDEYLLSIQSFIECKKEYNLLKENKDNWFWIKSIDNPISKIKNTAIGTLLIDITNDEDLDIAVTKFEKIIAPNNYKRPKSIITKKMIEEAENKINELGLQNSLLRRYAELEDISINNVLFIDRNIKNKLLNTIFDDLKESIPDNLKTLDKIEEINIDDFIKDILPKIANIELLFETRLQNNLMSLISPKDKNSPNIFKWNNNFSWSYNGEIADSMKQNVKNAGGNVEGVLRFSIQWNENNDNGNDFDAHCIEPDGNEIFYGNKYNRFTLGNLDVDIIRPDKKIAVENITWPDINKMQEGIYEFFVNNYNNRGGNSGFRAEIEYEGQIYSYDYYKDIKHKENVLVAKIEFNKKTGIKFIRSLDSTLSVKEIWNIKTNTFNKVSMFTLSPNFWDNQKIGNKHYFFILNGCKNDMTSRGFYNEFLKEDLLIYKKVFEVLGSKMRVESSNNQLSGIGFSSTQKNNVIVKVEGSFKRVLKIVF